LCQALQSWSRHRALISLNFWYYTLFESAITLNFEQIFGNTERKEIFKKGAKTKLFWYLQLCLANTAYLIA